MVAMITQALINNDRISACTMAISISAPAAEIAGTNLAGARVEGPHQL